uniref:Peptidase M13 C-terminal domain-containing protein n=1 Tax=Stomoxys calcitrans TaxID=35570 RepID=A0A1I8PBV3_STOCA
MEILNKRSGILFSLMQLMQVLALSKPLTNEMAIRQAKAMEMLKFMNLSADPCEDFYEFTCGNWNIYHSAALEDEVSTGLLEMLQKVLDANIMRLLQQPHALDTVIDKKVKDFYKSCLNLPSLKGEYANRLKAIIAEFGQMPALVGTSKWSQEENFDWLQTVGEISHKYGIDIITGAEVAVDLADNSVNRLYINQQELGLESKSVYLDADKDKAVLLRVLLLSVASKLNEFLQMDLEWALQTAQEIVDFETSLAQGIDDFESVAEFQENLPLTTMKELQQQYGLDIDFKKLLNLPMGSVPDLKVYYSPNYIENLIKVLKATPKSKVANYIFYQLVEKFFISLPQTKEELHTNCLANMKGYFSKIFDNMVYRHYSSKQLEQGINNMWLAIKSAFKKSLESAEQYPWIKTSTREYAIRKLEAMNMEIVSYENYNFSAAFRDLQVHEQDYLENLKSLRSLGAQQNREAINDPPEPLDLGEQLSTSPANILIENVVKLPVAMLQPNYVWSTYYAKAFNFGVLGALLAHELIHGFDDTGRNHDVQGNSLTWWDTESAENFQLRSQCFNSQYQEFVFQGKHLPDMPAQGENIADNGGVRMAYAAYLKWYDNAVREDNNDVRETMPGLQFEDKKLFFISYGQLWCGDVNPLYRKFQESTDSHVPDRFRVIGPLSNFEEFSKVFNCPKGSGMNPAKKCKIY